MTAKWGMCAVLAICLAALGGCRTPQPELKPPKVAEQFVVPPAEARYDTAAYPKQAFEKMEDPGLRAFENKGVIPARGGMMPGMGGVGR